MKARSISASTKVMTPQTSQGSISRLLSAATSRMTLLAMNQRPAMFRTPKACGSALPSRHRRHASPATRNLSRGTSSVSKSMSNRAR